MVASECPSIDDLQSFHLGTLDEVAADGLLHHAETCTHCQHTIDELEAVDDPFVEGFRAVQLTAGSGSALEESAPVMLQAVLERIHALGPKSWAGTSSEQSTQVPLPGLGPENRIGAYLLEVKLGAGGMGTVYRARHQRLDKPVALKLIPCQGVQQQDSVSRFEREMVAVGKLEHPHLVRAYDAGESEDGRYLYLVMELAEGLDAGELVTRMERLSVPNACEILRQSALGLEYIHQRNMVHRDIKPSNIMLAWSEDLEGNPRAIVKVLDLGLARFRHNLEELTLDGQVMGTLDYMSPEQAVPSAEVGPKSDLYSLGCTAFKLLSGRAPFAEEKHSHPIHKLQAHQTQSPPRLRKICPEVPKELETIITRLLAKKPHKRPSASELATAMKPFASGHTLEELLPKAQARTESITVPFSDRDTNKEDLKGPDDPTTIAPLPGLTGSEAAPKHTELQTAPALRKPSYRKMILAALGLVCMAVVMAQIILIFRNKDGEEIARVEVPADPKKAKANYAVPPGTRSVEALSKPAVPLPAIPSGEALSPNAIVDRPAKIKGLETWTLETVAPRGVVIAGACRPDGKQVATLSEGTTIRLWNVKTGELDRAFLTPGRGGYHPLAYSADGKRIASAGWDSVRVWDVDNGNLIMAADLTEQARAANVAFSPDGKTLASAALSDVRLWDIQTGKQVDLLQSKQMDIFHKVIAFSPDGKTLARASSQNIEIWDVEQAKRIHMMEHGITFDYTLMPELAWSPNGEQLAYSLGRTIQLWDAKTWKPGKKMATANPGYHGLAFRADGNQVAIGNDWFDVQTGELVKHANFELDEKHQFLLARSQNSQNPIELAMDQSHRLHQHSVVIRESLTWKILQELPANHTGIVAAPTWINNQEIVQSKTAWNIITGEKRPLTPDEQKHIRSLGPNSHYVESLLNISAPDGKHYYEASLQKGLVVKRYDQPNFRVVMDQSINNVAPHTGTSSTTSPLAWNHDASRIAALAGREFHVWDVPSGKLLWQVYYPSIAASFSPDGKILALSSLSDGARLFDTDTGKKLHDLKWTGGGPVVWSKEESQILTTGNGKIAYWDAKTGRKIQEKQWLPSYRIILSPDSSRVMVEHLPSMLRFWQFEDDLHFGSLIFLKNEKHLKVSPNGHYAGSPRVERELVYIAKTAKGQETYTPEEFSSKFGWKNDSKQATAAPARGEK